MADMYLVHCTIYRTISKGDKILCGISERILSYCIKSISAILANMRTVQQRFFGLMRETN